MVGGVAGVARRDTTVVFATYKEGQDMTTPGSADQVIFDQLNGGHPGAWSYYQVVRARARVTYGGLDVNQPFQFPLGAGGAKVAATPATMDAVTSAAEQVGFRHIDPYGNVMDPHKLWLVQWYWMLDGCPSPLKQSRLADYIALASVLRPWPTGFKGAMPGDPVADYPPFPAATPAPLDAFFPAESHEEQAELPHPPMSERFTDDLGGHGGGGGGGGHGGGGGGHGGGGGWGGGGHGGGGGDHGGGGWGGDHGGHGGWDHGGGGHRGWGDHDDHGWHRGWGDHGYGPGWENDYPPPWWWWLMHQEAPKAPMSRPYEPGWDDDDARGWGRGRWGRGPWRMPTSVPAPGAGHGGPYPPQPGAGHGGPYPHMAWDPHPWPGYGPYPYSERYNPPAPPWHGPLI